MSLVIPLGDHIYRGYLKLHNEEYLIQVQLGNIHHVYGSPELQVLVKEQEVRIEEKLVNATDIDTFLADLKEILEERHVPKQPSYSADQYAYIYKEITTIGYSRIVSISDTMNEIVFQLIDQEDRHHLMKVVLPLDYPFSLPEIHVELPKSIDLTTSLYPMFNQCEHIIQEHQPLFKALDELDQNMKIVEPAKPKRSDTYRRIALGYHCTLNLDIQPDNPYGKPKVRFFGNQQRTEAFLKKWKTSTWNKQDPIHANLMRILELDATKEEEAKRDDIECGICYAYKLNDSDIPEVICNQPTCNKGFHAACLYQWLRSNPSTTQSFNVLFGKCPYCSEKITIQAMI